MKTATLNKINRKLLAAIRDWENTDAADYTGLKVVHAVEALHKLLVAELEEPTKARMTLAEFRATKKVEPSLDAAFPDDDFASDDHGFSYVGGKFWIEDRADSGEFFIGSGATMEPFFPTLEAAEVALYRYLVDEGFLAKGVA